MLFTLGYIDLKDRIASVYCAIKKELIQKLNYNDKTANNGPAS